MIWEERSRASGFRIADAVRPAAFGIVAGWCVEWTIAGKEAPAERVQRQPSIPLCRRFQAVQSQDQTCRNAFGLISSASSLQVPRHFVTPA